MNHHEHNPGQLEMDDLSAPTTRIRNIETYSIPTVDINDGLFWGKLLKDNAESFFCPHCGAIQGNDGYCDCSDSHPERVLPLQIGSYEPYKSLIKAKNPIEPAQ